VVEDPAIPANWRAYGKEGEGVAGRGHRLWNFVCLQKGLEGGPTFGEKGGRNGMVH
jgi:hypothetical protein